MSNRVSAAVIAITIIGCLTPASLRGKQEPPGESPCPESVPLERQPFGCRVSPLELAAGLRADLDLMRYALEALVQYHRPHPPHELDALADTLVAIGVDYGRRPGMESKRVKDEVVGILDSAMRWSTPPYPNGEAYRRVGDRFMALARGLLPDEELTELVAVGGILDRVTGMLEQDDLADIIDRDEWLGHLRDFAMSRNWQAAHTAVQILGNERLAPAGSEILRELYYGNLVREPYAREILEGIALRRGWRR